MRAPARRWATGGFVTAETAVVLPVLVMVCLLAVWLLAAVGAQLGCVDAARAGARSAARGDPDAQVQRQARTLAPPGARVEVSSGTAIVTVVVRARVRPAGGLVRLLPGLAVSATATAERERRP